MDDGGPGRSLARRRGGWRAAWAFAALLAGCAPRSAPEPVVPPPPRLTVAQVARLIPSHVKEREGWAQDVLDALEAEEVTPTPVAVCSVLAIIEQESGFHADPAVPNLPRMVRTRLEEHANTLGPLGRKALASVLSGKAPGHKRTFDARLNALRTERDLDRLFRDMLAYYEQEYPATFAAMNLASSLFSSRRLEDLNPVTTAGSMQVSVRYAMEKVGEDADPVKVREALYTREGGVRFGTSRLMGFEAAYAQPLFRFADYNAGVYASRNAALQAQVSQLTRLPLVLDGDLQLYDKRGEPRAEDSKSLEALLSFRQRHAPELSERQVRRDVAKEKEESFEATDTFRAVKRVYANETGESPAYAQLPQVTLESPKLKGERTTAWFARSVDARFQKCQARHRAAQAK
ncbi:DUF1615 domain-containing protein [Myxococcus sp. K15C18031901]|uniref:DUF1615 family protein n=1 Tax=Myxococcus dinghuensis TaxID=2906761 RepID=UPI0020A73822|nr:DUF1615 family protein [Myxococcus dinghuensis]MCP3102152.1 DUF1615 domain-containing protein [Myxococcus dinghuensis]